MQPTTRRPWSSVWPFPLQGQSDNHRELKVPFRNTRFFRYQTYTSVILDLNASRDLFAKRFLGCTKKNQIIRHWVGSGGTFTPDWIHSCAPIILSTGFNLCPSHALSCCGFMLMIQPPFCTRYTLWRKSLHLLPIAVLPIPYALSNPWECAVATPCWKRFQLNRWQGDQKHR